MTEHSHDHDGHNHDHSHDQDREEEDEVIVLEDEDGDEHRFILGDVITVEKQDYAILLPVDDDLEEGVIFRIEGEEGEDMVLADIEGDEEWQKVVDAYNKYMDELEDEDEDS